MGMLGSAWSKFDVFPGSLSILSDSFYFSFYLFILWEKITRRHNGRKQMGRFWFSDLEQSGNHKKSYSIWPNFRIQVRFAVHAGH